MLQPASEMIIAFVMLCASAMPTAAATPQPVSVGALSALWYKVLTLPNPDNPFGDGGPAKGCIQIAPLVVSPFGPPCAVPSCTVRRGTKLIVTPGTNECSTFETPGKTPDELRECAEEADANVTKVTVTVDGHRVKATEVDTVVLTITLPADNIFALPKGTCGHSVGHGWVALLEPMAPGKHIINVKSSRSAGVNTDNTTEIIVRRY